MLRFRVQIHCVSCACSPPTSFLPLLRQLFSHPRIWGEPNTAFEGEPNKASEGQPNKAPEGEPKKLDCYQPPAIKLGRFQAAMGPCHQAPLALGSAVKTAEGTQAHPQSSFPKGGFLGGLLELLRELITGFVLRKVEGKNAGADGWKPVCGPGLFLDVEVLGEA